jgi:putative tryptophan/tyrosine transport system substrate-binding protein
VRRREFIVVLGGAAALAPLSVRGQPGMRLVGILSGTNHEDRLIGAVKQGLSEAGYVENQNVAFEYRFAQGQFDKLPALAADLVGREVAVIVAMQSATAPRAAKAVTASIPIVFSIGGDPVKLGLVESLNRPGGNVTGATFLVNTLAAKRLELLGEMLPKGARVGLLANPKNPASGPEISDVEQAASALGLHVHQQIASTPDEIDAAFSAFVKLEVSAVTFAADAVFNARRDQLIALAARNKLPTMYFYREFAAAGGLMSYGGFDTDAYRIAGIYAGRILKGEKPADLPVQQSTKVELVINLRTAKAQGVQMPPTLLARADEVIE